MKKLAISIMTFGQSLSYAQMPEMILPVGHNYRVMKAAFSPDKKYTVTSSTDGTAKVWETLTGKLVSTLQRNGQQINAAYFSPNGKYVITAFADSTSIFDPISGKLARIFPERISGVHSNIFGPGSNYILAFRGANAVVREIASGKAVHIFRQNSSALLDAAFSPDGNYIITLGSDKKIHTWSFLKRKIVRTNPFLFSVFQQPELSFSKKYVASYNNKTGYIWKLADGLLVRQLISPETINSLSLDAEGNFFVLASSDGITRIIETATGNRVDSIKGWPHGNKAFFIPGGKNILIKANDGSIKILQSPGGEIKLSPGIIKLPANGTEFSSDGKLLAVCYGIVTAIFQTEDGSLVTILKGHESEAKAVTFSADGKQLLITSSLTAKLWNVDEAKLARSTEGHASALRSACFSPDGKYIVTASMDRTAAVWESSTGKRISKLEGHSSYLNSAAFSPDGQYIVTTSDDSTGMVWHTGSGQKIATLRGHAAWVIQAVFSSDGKYIVTSSWDKTVKIWDSQAGQLVHSLACNGDATEAHFSPDGKLIVIAAGTTRAELWDARSGKRIYQLKGHTGEVRTARFSTDGNWIVTGSADNRAIIWETATGKIYKILKGHTGIINTAAFSFDGNFILTASRDSTVTLWNAHTGQSITRLEGHSGEVNSASFCSNGRYIVTASQDNTCKLWNATTGKAVANLVVLDNHEYFYQLAIQGVPPYYQGTKNAIRLLSFKKPAGIFSFEQFDIQYNRPDKVLEAIGNTDTALIKSYRKAWEKRIKKLGIDTTAFKDGYSVPEADFTNRDVIEYEQKTGTLKLLIKGNDSAYKLDRFNVWVNETPVFGQRGINIRKRNKNEFDTTITIKLSQGENKIETSVSNVNGTESYRMPLTVNYIPAVKQKESIRFIGIGIEQFSNSQYNLQYSVKDIRDLSKRLKEKYKDDIIIDTLFNENVTTSNVKAIKEKLQQTNENDKVIISYSGHGLLSKEYDYYLSTYSVNFDKPEENGLPYDALENLLDSIPARKKLMLIDACHSGEVDKEDLVRLAASSDSLIKGVTPVAYAGEGHLGLKNSFELMQNLFVNVGKSTGATIISAAAGTQFALERNDLKNGVFTYSILEAMNKYPTLKISELKKIVGARVEELTKGLQKPTSRNETIAVDWSLW